MPEEEQKKSEFLSPSEVVKCNCLNAASGSGNC